jgi:transposase-like protein
MAAIHQISSDFAPISATLPPIQAQVVAALAKGQTITAAAREAGIHRTTIHNWLRTEPNFKAAVETAQGDYTAALSDEMRELSALALANLRSLLEDPTTPPSVRLRAALAVLERPKFPDQGWSLPERIESPREQRVVDALAETEADCKAMRMAEAAVSHAAKADVPQTKPQPETSGPQHPKSDIQHPPSPSRCAPCPCGSGLKYKRCCGIASRPKYSNAPLAA